MKKKFGNHYFKYKDRLDYEKNLQHWITKYEVNNNKNIAYYFRDLLIDTHNDYILNSKTELFYLKLKQFYIFIDQLQNPESFTIVNNFDNNTLKKLSDKIASSILIVSYLFNLSTYLQYNDIKFKKSFIDLDAII